MQPWHMPVTATAYCRTVNHHSPLLIGLIHQQAFHHFKAKAPCHGQEVVEAMMEVEVEVDPMVLEAAGHHHQAVGHHHHHQEVHREVHQDGGHHHRHHRHHQEVPEVLEAQIQLDLDHLDYQAHKDHSVDGFHHQLGHLEAKLDGENTCGS